jgi:chromosomal replication initiator protein
VDVLAEAADGYRTLDGWLARLALTARVERRALDRSAVEALLAEPGSTSTTEGKAALESIARSVARQFGVRLSDLRSASRRQALTVPRHLAMYLGRERTGLSFAAIGRYFGKRDPATVRHACEAASARIAGDPTLVGRHTGAEHSADR